MPSGQPDGPDGALEVCGLVGVGVHDGRDLVVGGRRSRKAPSSGVGGESGIR